MIVPGCAGVHLTYCTNIHPAETWDQVFANVSTHVRAVKARVCPDRPFGIGLRLSASAAARLAQPTVLAAFREFLAAHQLYVFTINGFPHGTFHGTAVKEQVYRPDWLEDERLTYTDLLSTLLASLLPDDSDVEGSVSTVPGCFSTRGDMTSVGPAIAERLFRHAVTLHRLREHTGKIVSVALEPEPACVLETTADAVRFFSNHVFSPAGIAAFARLTGLGATEAEDSLRLHLGVCLDACHAAVEFENPEESIRLLQGAGIRIAKIQVSAGLQVDPRSVGARAALERFAEGVYLHQTVVRRGANLTRFVDLPEALAACDKAAPGDEWRVHFHVPLFRETFGPLRNSAQFLRALLSMQATESLSRHLEVETYTWDVLPEEFRAEPIDDAIARELRWTLDALKPCP